MFRGAFLLVNSPTNLFAMKLFFLSATLLAASSTLHAQNTQYLDAGNIRSLIGTAGQMWRDTASMQARCEYPKASGKHVGYAADLWVGGYDTQGQLKVAANTYRQGGNDYWQGPIPASGSSTPALQAEWDKIWKVTRADMDAFFSTTNHTVSNTPQAILRWPGRGNTFALSATGAPLNLALLSGDLAPFVDLNGDGSYTPLTGEYPRFYGDQTLWQMYNDAGGTKTATGTGPLALQIGLLAWSYNRGTVADNIQFYEYNIANRGGQIDSCVVSIFTDLDLGFASDDYIGFDSSHRMGYQYNSGATDGSVGQSGSYGTQIPIAGIALLRAAGDEPLTGTRVPAGAFNYFNNAGVGFPSEIIDPASGIEFYRYMTGTNRLGNPFTRDFTGQANMPTRGYGAGPNTRYVFDGVPSVAGTWSECYSGNTSGDRRFILSSSPFTLPAGEARTVAFALVVSPNAGGCPNTTLTGLQQTADTAIKLYDNPPSFTPNSVAQSFNEKMPLRLFPNPAGDALFIQVESISLDARVEVVDVAGRRLHAAVDRTGSGFRVSTMHLPAGVYAVRLLDAGSSVNATFVKQ